MRGAVAVGHWTTGGLTSGLAGAGKPGIGSQAQGPVAKTAPCLRSSVRPLLSEWIHGSLQVRSHQWPRPACRLSTSLRWTLHYRDPLLALPLTSFSSTIPFAVPLPARLRGTLRECACSASHILYLCVCDFPPCRRDTCPARSQRDLLASPPSLRETLSFSSLARPYSNCINLPTSDRRQFRVLKTG